MTLSGQAGLRHRSLNRLRRFVGFKYRAMNRLFRRWKLPRYLPGSHPVQRP